MRPAHRRRALRGALFSVALVAASVAIAGSPADAAQADVGLGSADSFAVLAGAGITNTGPTTITGDVGTFPTTTESGFGSVTLTGTNHAGDAVTQQAKTDLVTGYNDAAGRGPATVEPQDLVGLTLGPGVYNTASGALENSGVLVLDGQNLTNPVFVFEAASTLTTGPGSSVSLINGADACNVYWRIGSSATLGTGSSFVGTIMALTSVTLTTGATLQGRALARNGAVTLDTNTITRASCATPTSTTTTVTSSPNPPVAGQPVTLTAAVTAANGSTPTGTVEFFDNGTSLGTAAVDSAGNAVLTTPALGPGAHEITAQFLGGAGFLASSVATLNQITPVVVVPTFTG